jgi:hypothetical protein
MSLEEVFKNKLVLDDNYDNLILKKYSSKYERLNTIQKMVQKHSLSNCECKKKNKICIYNEYNEDYIILYKVKEKYQSSIIEGDDYVKKNINFFETLYNTSQSITQSLKSCAGRDLENSIEEVFKENNFYNFATQVFICNEGIFREKKIKGKNKGHIIDFIVPPPEYGTHFKNHKGIIISVKTTARERFHQDKYLKKFTFITLEDFKIDNEDINVIYIKKDGNAFTSFLKKLIKEYS